MPPISNNYRSGTIPCTYCHTASALYKANRTTCEDHSTELEKENKRQLKAEIWKAALSDIRQCFWLKLTHGKVTRHRIRYEHGWPISVALPNSDLHKISLKVVRRATLSFFPSSLCTKIRVDSMRLVACCVPFASGSFLRMSRIVSSPCIVHFPPQRSVTIMRTCSLCHGIAPVTWMVLLGCAFAVPVQLPDSGPIPIPFPISVSDSESGSESESESSESE